jgi:anti-sigma B factor antagonist
MSLSVSGNFDKKEKIWIFDLLGDVDISNAHLLKRQLETAYEKKHANIAVNLSKLDYIDSTGLGVIIGTHGMMSAKGHRIILREPKENVKKLLRITNLDKVLCDGGK